MSSLNIDCENSSKTSKYLKSPLKTLLKVADSEVVIETLKSLGEREHLTVSTVAKEFFKAAVTTLIGSNNGASGLIAALAVGAAAALKNRNENKKVKKLQEVFESMSPELKEELTNIIMEKLKSSDVPNLTAATLSSLISSKDVKDTVMLILKDFLKNKMGLELQKGECQ